MKNIKQKVIGVVAVAIAVSLFSAFYMIEEGQQAVIVQFGRPVGETVTEAGLHIKIPFIQEVRRSRNASLSGMEIPIRSRPKDGSLSGSTRRRAGGSPMQGNFWKT